MTAVPNFEEKSYRGMDLKLSGIQLGCCRFRTVFFGHAKNERHPESNFE